MCGEQWKFVRYGTAYNLAENIIRLSGVQGITIQKIGLCPGEKIV